MTEMRTKTSNTVATTKTTSVTVFDLRAKFFHSLVVLYFLLVTLFALEWHKSIPRQKHTFPLYWANVRRGREGGSRCSEDGKCVH